MIEYYVKMIQDHPLLTYIEDAFAQFDFVAHKSFREKLSNEFPQVNMALKQIFAKGGLQRLKMVTDFDAMPTSQCEDRVKSPGEESKITDNAPSKLSKGGKGTPSDKDKGGKKTTPGGTLIEDPSATEFPESDPANPNKNKITPDCAHIDLGHVLTMSELLKYFVYAQNLDEEQ